MTIFTEMKTINKKNIISPIKTSVAIHIPARFLISAKQEFHEFITNVC